MRIDANGEVANNARLYLRLNEDLTSTTSQTNQSASLLTEELYGFPARVTVIGNGNAFPALLATGPAVSADTTSKGTGFTGKQAIAMSYWDGSEVDAEYGPMKDFDCTEDFSISVWFRPINTSFANDGAVASGPLINGVDKNDRPWGLYLLGKVSAHSSTWQQIGFVFAYQKSNGQMRFIYNDVDAGGIRIQQGTWTNIIVSKTAGDVVQMRCGNRTGLRFGHISGGSVDAREMIDLLVGDQGGMTLSSITDTSDYTNFVPDWTSSGLGGVALGGEDHDELTYSTVIGLAVHSHMVNWGDNGGPVPFTVYTHETSASSGAFDLVCGIDGSSNSFTKNTNASSTQWLSKTYLSEVAIFGHALSATEMDEIFSSTGIW